MKKLLLKALSLALASSMVITPAMAAPKVSKDPIRKNVKASDAQGVTQKRDRAIKKKVTKKEFKRVDSLINKNKKREKLKKFKFKKLKSAKARKARIKKMDAMMKSAQKNFSADEKAAYKVWSQLTAKEKDAVVSSHSSRSLGYIPGVALAIGVVTLARAVYKEYEREEEIKGTNGVQDTNDVDNLNKALDF